jgi:hypothetical protein
MQTFIGKGFGLAVAATAVLGAPAFAAKETKVAIAPQEAVVRRLTGEQYHAIIRDVFGPTIAFGGHFEPGLKVNGLAAAGTSTIGVTPAGMEQYDAMARAIADQVVSADYREQMIPCTPAAAKKADDACARQFLGSVGRLLYRRPLPASSLASHVVAAHAAAEATHDFYQGVALSLAAMLSSPQFLFRDAEIEADPDNKGGHRLDAYSKASELSFFLWNAGPDLALLTAAEKGELETQKGLERQVDRMMASPRLEAGLRAFFMDNFAFDEFADLTKDVVLFPKFSAQATSDAQEQTLKTVVQLLLKEKGDYRDLFTTRKTFLTPELGAIYRVPLVDNRPTGTPDGWAPYEFAADDRRAGILTHMSFTALHSPAGRGSPTLRGKALREVILCQKVPPPPGNVQFNIVQDTNNPLYKTARDRLTAHRANPACAGCHKITDPMGLALENFDGAGEYRTAENGKAIDTSGELDGIAFADAEGLGKAVHDNPATASCLVNRLASYALGRAPGAGEAPWINYLQTAFAADGYRVPDLMREISVSEAFYQRALPRPPATATASNAAQQEAK